MIAILNAITSDITKPDPFVACRSSVIRDLVGLFRKSVDLEVNGMAWQRTTANEIGFSLLRVCIDQCIVWIKARIKQRFEGINNARGSTADCIRVLVYFDDKKTTSRS